MRGRSVRGRTAKFEISFRRARPDWPTIHAGRGLESAINPSTKEDTDQSESVVLHVSRDDGQRLCQFPAISNWLVQR